MISALTGELRRVDDDRVHLQVGPILFELMVPAADVPLLKGAAGSEMTFHTIFYLEGDASGGNIDPRLVGFQQPEDRAFFQLFITVKGIGPKKALRVLTAPVSEIAHAIESRDTRFLCELPQIGKRMAELIVAELAGKLEGFAIGQPRAAGVSPSRGRTPAEEDAVAALIALGERPADAQHLLDRAKHADDQITTTSQLVNEMLRLRTVRG